MSCPVFYGSRDEGKVLQLKGKIVEKIINIGGNVFVNGFTDALEQRNLEELRKYPKADLHNHFVLGGN